MKKTFSLLTGYFSLAQPKGKVGTALGVLAEIFTILFGGWDKLLTTLQGRMGWLGQKSDNPYGGISSL